MDVPGNDNERCDKSKIFLINHRFERYVNLVGKILGCTIGVAILICFSQKVITKFK